MNQLAKFKLLSVAPWLLALNILFPSLALCKLTGSLSEEAIVQRLQPMGQVNVVGMPVLGSEAAVPAMSVGVGGPEKIYDNNCKVCHGVGLAGAPKFGSKADWQPRIAQGLDVLYKTAWTGIRAMPPKGNCLQCTEEDIKKTVDYMVNAAK